MMTIVIDAIIKWSDLCRTSRIGSQWQEMMIAQGACPVQLPLLSATVPPSLLASCDTGRFWCRHRHRYCFGCHGWPLVWLLIVTLALILLTGAFVAHGFITGAAYNWTEAGMLRHPKRQVADREGALEIPHLTSPLTIRSTKSCPVCNSQSQCWSVRRILSVLSVSSCFCSLAAFDSPRRSFHRPHNHSYSRLSCCTPGYDDC